MEDYQLVGFDSLFAELKRLAVVDWELAELEGDELPAGSESAAAAADPVVGPQPAAVEGEARPCWSDVAAVAAVAGDVLPLVVASCFAEAAAGFGPPEQFAIDVRLADEGLVENYAELLQIAKAAVGQWTVTTSETEMLQAVAVNLSEVSFEALGWGTKADHVGEETDRGPEGFEQTHLHYTSDE